jgi:uncharacterized protein
LEIFKTMIDLLLMITFGFLGSFGHCASMCGSLAIALATNSEPAERTWRQSWWFHSTINFSRVISYGLGGAALGGASAIIIASGQLVGVGSQLRSIVALAGGLLLIWSGLGQVFPGSWPLPAFLQTCRHSVNQATKQPWLLGLLWGFMPCGFLYTAQLKAIESASVSGGALTMLAFGLGTTPVMMGIGVSAGYFSLERRSQLRRAGGWIAISVGMITLGRSGDSTSDGYGALICLILALIARPVSKLWPWLLSYRRLLGVSAVVLAITHMLHMIHGWDWNLGAVWFLLPGQQAGIAAGGAALLLLLPAVVTSFDRAQSYLGSNWRKLHLLSIPALMLATTHGVLTGANYLGTVQITVDRQAKSIAFALVVSLVFLIRWRWLILFLEKFYVSVKSQIKL